MKTKTSLSFIFRSSFLVILLVAFLFSGFQVPQVHAAAMRGYEALQVQVPTRLSMIPLETKTVTLTFQNLGSKTWAPSGTEYVSLYTHGPKYRASVFQNSTWVASSQPAKLSESSVIKGSVGTISFSLTAPAKEGTYQETFALASESTAWIPGGQFTLSIEVKNPSTSSSKESKKTESEENLSAEILTTSATKIKARGGISVMYTASFKNTGSSAWESYSLKTNKISMANISASDIKHSSWKSSSVVLEESTDVGSGESNTFTFAFKTPSYKGSYTASFMLSVDGENVEGGQIDIPVEVTSDAPDAKASKKTSKNDTTTKDEETKEEDGILQNIIIEEPMIRVGILTVDEETDDEIVIMSTDGDMRLEDLDGELLAEVSEDEEITAYYKNDRYYYVIDGERSKSAKALRFVPEKEDAILKITNFDRKVTRGSKYSDNEFRNILEIRYNETKDRVWMINELGMETYLKGLAETSNDSHAEFQKTLIIAARTYAYYHWQRATKHAKEFFHVEAYLDQVYKGYGQEARTPTLSNAVDATRGITVTYDGNTAITAYFSRSDGRTRDWSEVWGGTVPWSKSVSVPCDKGKTLWGHGVGMSASGALCMANEGEKFQEILHHFYTDIDLEKRWE